MIGNLREKLSILESNRPTGQPEAQGPAAGADIRCRCFSDRIDISEVMGDGGLTALSEATAAELSAVFRCAVDPDFSPEQMIFLDTETTGLSGGAGTVAFLIGIGRFTGGHFHLEQYFMQDYDREADMLERLCVRLTSARYLVTFNGKCFDAPLIASRSVINRIRQPLDRLVHLDLLHPARRLYRRRLESCGLGRLENEIMGIFREGDIPGSEIPEIFFSYLRDGDFTRLEQVVAHNRQDILSLGRLMDALCRAYRDPGGLTDPWDIYSCGRIFEDQDDDRARDCYLRAMPALPESRRALAEWYKRRGDYGQAVPLWQEMTARGECGSHGYVELAKYYEHRVRDYEKALGWSQKALERLRAMGFHDTMQEEARALGDRIRRLARRIENGRMKP